MDGASNLKIPIKMLRHPGLVLHSGVQEVVLLVPALPRVVDLAGPLGLLFPPATTRYVLVESVVRPPARIRQGGALEKWDTR